MLQDVRNSVIIIHTVFGAQLQAYVTCCAAVLTEPDVCVFLVVFLDFSRVISHHKWLSALVNILCGVYVCDLTHSLTKLMWSINEDKRTRKKEKLL